MLDTSQNGETTLIMPYLPVQGLFLDIGSNDGKTLSNTYGLYLQGWRGVNVEPSPEAFRRLAENQPLSENINAAIGECKGRVVLHESGEHLGQGDVSLLSTLLPAEKGRWTKEVFTEVEVDMLAAEDIIRGRLFDLLSIDIEGMELTVLPGIMQRIRPKVAIIEWNGQNGREYHEIMHGYKRIGMNNENLIFLLG